MYSSYKTHTTYKGNVVISPSGEMIHISSLFAGSISGKELVKQSGLFCKQQFSKGELLRSKTIQNLQVHVERAIKRVKEFHFFDRVIPLTMAGSINQIWT
ncbi:unnamed protein product, partial [Porites lobata]